MTNPYRGLPSVDRLLQHPALDGVRREIPYERLTAYGRAALQQARDVIHSAPGSRPDGAPPAFSIDGLAAAVLSRVQDATTPTLHPVINASGVILHTNLGRAPLSEATRAAMSAAGVGYSNLEFDLGGGRRGSRLDHLDRLLREVTGAEAGMAVNNNAAAVLLGLSALAAGREVMVSRGQAVEIGGGFRIPDVLRQSGAELVEVGTTNRTRAADYRNAISERTAALLRVHTSNYKIVGFTEQAGLADLRAVASEAGALLLDDLGSGCLLDTARYGLAPEPTPAQSLSAGADLVFFSGDKLLGGPQAGIIVGRTDLIEVLKRHPLARAMRMDKATIGGLSATLLHYLRGEAESQIPIWRMIAAPAEAQRARAESWQAALGFGEVEAAESMVGGGSLPGESLPSFVLAVRALPVRAERIAERLRAADPPVVARIDHDAVLLDPRTVQADEDADLLRALRTAVVAESDA